MSLPNELQTLLVRTYYDMNFSRYYFLTIENKADAAKFLAEYNDGPEQYGWSFLGQWDRNPSSMTLHLGLTFAGMHMICGDKIDPYTLFTSFTSYVRGPMLSARSSKTQCMGDPTNWRDIFKPDQSSETHLVVTAYGQFEEELNEWETGFLKSLPKFGLKLQETDDLWSKSHVLPGGLDQFLYKEPISQPVARSDIKPQRYPNPQPPVADWVMYLVDDDAAFYNLKPFEETFRNDLALKLLENGGFSAFCLFQMRPVRFQKYLINAAHATGMSIETLAGKMLGRFRKTGTPLALSDNPKVVMPDNEINNFNYNPDDLDGYHCPPGAHIRRVNARGDNIAGNVDVHRILRQPYSYGSMFDPCNLSDEEDQVDRGLVGHYIGSSIEHQFEFILEQWLNTGTFAGLPSNSGGPLLGSRYGVTAPDASVEKFQFQIPMKEGGPISLVNMPRFVYPRGFSYQFFPSHTGIAMLAELMG